MMVSEQLAAFLRATVEDGVPAPALHEAKRLLLNQLKASVGAVDHPAIRIFDGWAASAPGPAHVLWLGTETTVERAAFVNGAFFEVLDFHDTYIPTYLHAVSPVLPAVLAVAESEGHAGSHVIAALALGIEVDLALATILMPTGYFRGFVPAGLVGGVGAAAACAVLGGLDLSQTRDALDLAMLTAGGTYESVGSMALSYITGVTARSGVTAYEMAARGVDAPVTAFEGEMGMLGAYSDEPADKIEGVMASLGGEWRIHGQSYKTMPTETITHGPVESVLRLREAANGRQVAGMRFGVEQIVVKIADERMERFGAPSSELEARFDLRHCAAAAWVRGRFTLNEMREPAYTDPEILDLRSRIALFADRDRPTFEGSSLEISYTDGSTDAINIDAFKGSAPNPLTDGELADVMRSASEEFLPEGRADEITDAVLTLETARDIGDLMALLRY